MKNSLLSLSVIPLILLLCLIFSCGQQREKKDIEQEVMDDLQLNKIPAWLWMP
jgi:hypothetical protein